MKKATLIFFVLFVLSFQYIYAQSSSDRAKAYYFEAVTSFGNKNYQKALDYCKEVEGILGSSNARVEVLRIKSYFELGNVNQAKQALNRFSSYGADETLKREIAPYIVKIEDIEKREEAKQEQIKNINIEVEAKKAAERFINRSNIGYYGNYTIGLLNTGGISMRWTRQAGRQDKRYGFDTGAFGSMICDVRKNGTYNSSTKKIRMTFNGISKASYDFRMYTDSRTFSETMDVFMDVSVEISLNKYGITMSYLSSSSPRYKINSGNGASLYEFNEGYFDNVRSVFNEKLSDVYKSMKRDISNLHEEITLEEFESIAFEKDPDLFFKTFVNILGRKIGQNMSSE